MSIMYNWNTNTSALKKDPEKYTIWKLEQLINYGLNGEKINEKDLKKYWNKLTLDQKRRRVLSFWLWPKQS